MTSPNSHIKFYAFSILLIAAGRNIAHSQQPVTRVDFDTSNLTIRVCNGGLTAPEKQPYTNYEDVVCAYRFKRRKLIQYKVIGFDLVSKGSDGKTEIVSTEGGQFSPMMKMMLIRADNAEKLRNLFLDNVKLLHTDNRIVVIKGLRSLLVNQ